jgi:hypothetical protein
MLSHLQPLTAATSWPASQADAAAMPLHAPARTGAGAPTPAQPHADSRPHEDEHSHPHPRAVLQPDTAMPAVATLLMRAAVVRVGAAGALLALLWLAVAWAMGSDA